MNKENQKSKLEILNEISENIEELKIKLLNSKREVDLSPLRTSRGKGNKVKI